MPASSPRRGGGSGREHLDDPALEARLIVEHFTGTERADAVRTPEQPVAPDVAATIDRAIERRLAGEPVHRIFGYRDFYGLRLALSPETLEPRPDTETLVDAILPFLREVVKREGRCRILDLGTGTGAIGLALASQIPESLVTATDISAEALATAAGNAAAAGVSNRFSRAAFRLVFGSWREISCNRLKPSLYTQ